jgi:hypothetical protein
MSREEFGAKVKRWQAAGAPCPADTAKKAAATTRLAKLCSMASGNSERN